MSHFTVIVIGDNAEQQLQPYHEYECTGMEDEYVQFVEAEENLENEFKEHPEYATIKEFAEQYHGYHEENGKYGRKTNPNAKWDWYLLGGRWTGFFKLKEGIIGTTGKPGIMTETAKFGYADAALKKHIDFEGMRNEDADNAAKKYDEVMKVFKHLPVNVSWEDIRKDYDDSQMDAARKKYWEQPRCVAWKKSKAGESFFDSPDNYLITREEYIENARRSAISSFALVKESKWHEKGEMGFWGMARNEKDQSDWDTELNKLLDSVSDDTLISLYDCHI